jgi:uncharacterized Zn-finger protein
MSKIELSNNNRIEVTDSMLPICCPLPSEELWNKHPRVFLPVKQEGQGQCPYCGTKFVYIGAHSA